MKKIFSFVFVAGLMISASALANPADWLTCNTGGDAIESLTVGINFAGRPESVQVLTVLSMSDGSSTPSSTEVSGEAFDAMSNSGHFEFVFKGAKTVEFGGATSDASLLTLNESETDGAFTGKLAANGVIFELTCKRVQGDSAE